MGKGSNKKEKRMTSYQLAIYIAENHGHDFTDEQLTEIAKELKHNAKVLIKNFRSVCSIQNIVKALQEVED